MKLLADLGDVAEHHMARFWSSVATAPGNQCWPWTSTRQKRRNGALSYGIFVIGKRRILAHRFAWAVARGYLDRDLNVCHKCDDPGCVRPGHLFLGTQADNLADMRRKGRGVTNPFPCGTKHPKAKIDGSIATEIRSLRATGLSLAKIGVRVGLHASTVHDIVHGRTWR